jgi:hypothetical protein
MMIVYLWEAIGSVYRRHGISDDLGRARHAAAACVRRGDAPSALVEEAHAHLGTETLSSGYQCTGNGWRAQLTGSGRVRWEPLQARERAPARS